MTKSRNFANPPQAANPPAASKKQAALGKIDSDTTYTLERLAVDLGVTPRTLREEYINTGELMAMRFGRSYLIPGYVFQQLVIANLERCEIK